METKKVDVSFGSCIIKGAMSGELRKRKLYVGMKLQRIDADLAEKIRGISARTKLSNREKIIEGYRDDADRKSAEIGLRASFEALSDHIIEWDFRDNPGKKDLVGYLMEKSESDIQKIESALDLLSSVSEDERKNSGGQSLKGKQ